MKHLFIDMDGVIADFEGGCEGDLNRMYNKGFWEYLQPLEEDTNGIIESLQKQGYEVHILTKLPVERSDNRFINMTIEKVRWLMKHTPSLETLNIHILPYNEEKSIVLQHYENKEKCVLIDDYMPNLVSWMKCGGKGVKKAKRFKDTRVISQVLSIKELVGVDL